MIPKEVNEFATRLQLLKDSQDMLSLTGIRKIPVNRTQICEDY